MEFKIDVRRGVAENAMLYYGKSKKSKKKIEGAKKALEETLDKIEGLKKEQESVVGKIQVKVREKEGREKRWYERFRWFFSSDGFLVIGGKDSATNEILIKKYLEKNDLVFHADVRGAPFFVIKNPDNREIPGDALRETAEMAASYSSAWKSGLGSCDIYYVKPDQVSKKAPAGEYLTRGAFMIHGKKEWFRGVELRVGVGIKINENVEVVGGPISVVEKKSDYYVRIGVGDRKSGILAKEILGRILKNAREEDRERIMGVKIEEMQGWIPAGRGMLVR